MNIGLDNAAIDAWPGIDDLNGGCNIDQAIASRKIRTLVILHRLTGIRVFVLSWIINQVHKIQGALN